MLHLLKQNVNGAFQEYFLSLAAMLVNISVTAPDTCDSLPSTEHIETMMQLLTAVVKKFPLIVPEKSK